MSTKTCIARSSPRFNTGPYLVMFINGLLQGLNSDPNPALNADEKRYSDQSKVNSILINDANINLTLITHQ